MPTSPNGRERGNALLYSVSATATFEASHQIEGSEDNCHRVHGHSWVVTAQASHEEMDDGEPRGSRGLLLALRALTDELDGRDLAAMLPDMIHSPAAIASYLFERLAATFPGLVKVEVCWPNKMACGSASATYSRALGL